MRKHRLSFASQQDTARTGVSDIAESLCYSHDLSMLINILVYLMERDSGNRTHHSLFSAIPLVLQTRRGASPLPPIQV